MKRIVIIALLLSGCVQAVPFKSADGKNNYYVSCPSMDQCYKKAADSCPQGFNIVDRSDRSGELVGAAALISTPNRAANITISCKS